MPRVPGPGGGEHHSRYCSHYRHYYRQVGVVFLPCGHLVTCTTCAASVTKCVVCRAQVTEAVRVYMA